MVPSLPTASSTAVPFPKEAATLDAAAIFQLGRLAASYENRAWAREKVRQAKHNLSAAIAQELHSDNSGSNVARDQFKDREQVLVSLERFYKKTRHETHDKFPQAIAVMELMIPGSTHGLAGAVPKVKAVVSTSGGPEVTP